MSVKRSLAAATAATALALALAACSSGGTPSTTSAGSSAPSCHQQYETWKNSAATEKIKADLKALGTASSNEDLLKIRSSIITTARAVSAAPHIPHCADPAGYYSQMLGHLSAAADNIRSQSGVGGLLLAGPPVKAMEKASTKLSAELRKTTGE